jgi:hypothetical protein
MLQPTLTHTVTRIVSHFHNDLAAGGRLRSSRRSEGQNVGLWLEFGAMRHCPESRLMNGITKPYRQFSIAIPTVLPRTSLLKRCPIVLLLASILLTLSSPWFGQANANQTTDQPAGPDGQIEAGGDGCLNGKTARERFSKSGVVVDEMGSPAAGVSVTGFGFEEQFNRTATTDSQGRFTLNWQPPRIGFGFFVASHADGRQGVFQWSEFDLFGTGPVRIVLKAPRKLAVDVVDPKGAPVAGATVAVKAINCAASGQTDVNGRWTTQLPADLIVWQVLALKSGLGFDHFGTRIKTREPARNPLPDHILLKLDGAQSVEITAVDTSGKPVAGARILPISLKKPGQVDTVYLEDIPNANLRTDAAGVAVFDWIPTALMGRIEFCDYPGEYRTSTGVSIGPGAGPAAETMVLKHRQRLRGRAQFADGRPAGNVEVEAAGSRARFNGGDRVLTKADGSYEMTLSSDQSYIVSMKDDHWAALSYIGVAVQEGKDVDGVDFTLTEGTIVRGRVTVGPDRQPLEIAWVSLWMGTDVLPAFKPGETPYRLQTNRSAIVNAQGEYRLCVGQGRFKLYIAYGPLQSESIELLIRDQPEIVHDFHIPRTPIGNVEGRVVDGQMQPVAGATVDGASLAARFSFRKGITTKDGKFQFEGALMPIVLHARTNDGVQAGMARIGSDDQSRTIRLAPAASAHGRLLDDSGQIIAGGRLQYGIRVAGNQIKKEGLDPISFLDTATTESDGKFVLRALIPGQEYVLEYNREKEIWAGGIPLTTLKAVNSDMLELGDIRLPVLE